MQYASVTKGDTVLTIHSDEFCWDGNNPRAVECNIGTILASGWGASCVYSDDSTAPKKFSNRIDMYCYVLYGCDLYDYVEQLIDDTAIMQDIDYVNIANAVMDAIISNFSAKYVHAIIHAYVHSGVSLSTTDGYPFNDRYDGGIAGIIYAPKGSEGLTDSDILTALESEVTTLGYYISGDVYGYEITSACSNAGACYGYIGEFDEQIQAMQSDVCDVYKPLFDAVKYGKDVTL